MKKIIRLTESDLHKIVKESVQNILKEEMINGEYYEPIENDRYFENIECHRVFNENFDGNWRAVLTANLYDKTGKYVGKLNDLHFIYDVENDEFKGVW